MILIADLLGILAFRIRAIRALAERHSVVLGIVCFILGHGAYIYVRKSVYAALPEALSHPAGAFGALLNLNLIQTLHFLLLVYIPAVAIIAKAITGNGFGFSISRQEYQAHCSALLSVWGILYMISAPIQLLVPHFLIFGIVEISIGILVRSLLMFVYTLWAIKQLNYLSVMQAAGVFALSWLTFPLFAALFIIYLRCRSFF